MRSGSLGAPELDDEAARMADELLWAETSERRGALFVDVVGPAPRLIVFGAVDIAASLCSLARAAGWRPYVVDPRARFATRERFPDAEEVIAAWPEEAVARLGGIDPATSIVVLTHDPKLDDAALVLALRSPARFVGAMGSRRAQAKRRERLLALGMGEDETGAPVRAGRPRPRRDQRARRPRCRSWPRSSPPAMGATAGGSPTRKGRIHEVPA